MLPSQCGLPWLFYLKLKHPILLYSPWKVKVKVSSHSCVWLFAFLWTAECLFPLSMEFSKQEYWSGLPFPSLGDLPHPGIKPRSPALQMDSLPSYSLYLVLFFHVTWHLLHYFSCLSYIFFIVHLLPLECKLHCVLNCWYVPRIWNTIQGIVGLP